MYGKLKFNEIVTLEEKSRTCVSKNYLTKISSSTYLHCPIQVELHICLKLSESKFQLIVPLADGSYSFFNSLEANLSNCVI